MRVFLSLIRDPEKSRLDIFCYDEKEVPNLDEILRKKFRFCIFRTDRDSILAFRTEEYSEVKDIMQKLKKFYGFKWAGEPLIYDTEIKGGDTMTKKKQIKYKLGAPSKDKKNKNPFLNPDGSFDLIERFPVYEKKKIKKNRKKKRKSGNH